MRKLLYSNGSPFARRVRVVLIEKDLAFDSDIDDRLRPIEEIRPHNPALQVPVLYDGEKVLFGSNLIIQYLYATYPNSPTTSNEPPLAPSITRPDQHWEDSLTLTAIESMADSIVGTRLLLSAGPVEAPYVARQLERVRSCLDWLEQRITPTGFWPGTFSVMDMNLMFPLLFAEKRGAFDYRGGRWPKITAMIDYWRIRPSIVATPINELR